LHEVGIAKHDDKVDWRVVHLLCSLYSFDMRNLSRAACVHMDHVLSGWYSLPFICCHCSC